MRVHHLNCISACPLGGPLVDGAAGGALRARLTSHCLLLEADRGLVLVDTGYGLRDVTDPAGRLGRLLLMLGAPQLREDMTAVRQVERLGFRASDVRQIVLSHLDFDHAGGIDDFPRAEVHLLADEVQAATARRSATDRLRYRPRQWDTAARWRTYAPDEGQRWFGFDCVHDLPGVGPEVLLVPLVGHTLGHAGVAVQRARGWLLYAADAYYFHGEMDLDRPWCPPGLRWYQSLLEKDRRMRLLNQHRLRMLRGDSGDEVTIFCAHDVVEFERLAQRRFDAPPGGAPASTPPAPPTHRSPPPRTPPTPCPTRSRAPGGG